MKLYTANELAELLQIHPRTVYRLGREGKLKHVRVSRSVKKKKKKKKKDRWVKNGT